MAAIQRGELRWKPWSSVPRDGSLVLTLLYNEEIWIGKWQEDGLPMPPGYVAMTTDELAIGWSPLTDDLKEELGAA